jgi:hypothetical protein
MIDSTERTRRHQVVKILMISSSQAPRPYRWQQEHHSGNPSSGKLEAALSSLLGLVKQLRQKAAQAAFQTTTLSFKFSQRKIAC